MAKRSRAKPATQAASGAERRRFQRARLDLLVQHRYEKLQDFMQEMAIDISVGGMFVRTERPHPEGSTVYLRFALADGLALVEGIGRVVRVNPPSDSERTPGMGIEFVSLDEDSHKLIDSLVAGGVDEPTPPTVAN